MEGLKSLCREIGLGGCERDLQRNRCGAWTRVLAVGEQKRGFRRHLARTFHKAGQKLVAK